MLYLESFVHRVQLAEVVSRWIVNQPRPGDVEKINKIINFNSYIARIWADHLAGDLFTALYHRPPASFVAKNKGQLKDFIVDNPLDHNSRIAELFARYRRFPEDFYRDTPFDGRVYYLDQPNGKHTYVGSTRIKRFRRIAEKGSRRIVDYMFDRIRANADVLAEERAKALGIAKHQLITPPEQQVAEFMHAERRLIKAMRRGTLQPEFPVLTIPDTVGLKVLAQGDQYHRLVDHLQSNDDYQLLEQEHHTGRYNAINLRVQYRIPKDLLLKQAPSLDHRRLLSYRGFDPDLIDEQYRSFLADAEDRLRLEIIVCSYGEFLESEIGRSMHEDRIFEQRAEPGYTGHLATNVMHLMDYMLMLCLAPTHGLEIEDVPIKLWVKYMPDTMDQLQRGLFNVPVDASFDDEHPLDERPALRGTNVTIDGKRRLPKQPLLQHAPGPVTLADPLAPESKNDV